MPTIYDNIENDLTDGLRKMLKDARRADFCAGYFNLRGWGQIAESVAQLRGEDGEFCRLLIGMSPSPEHAVREGYRAGGAKEMTQENVHLEMRKAVSRFAVQLTLGCPTGEDERNLRRLAEQLREGAVRVKFHGRHPLHAKLYLIHRADRVAAMAGVVGSSNLTLAGLEKNYELNVDVLEQDAAQKLAQWFEDRWNDSWSADITADIAEVIERSWARGAVPPYHVYVKTAFELSRDAVSGVGEYGLPPEFRGKLLDFQEKAVAIAAKILHKRDGVIIGDVVGLGKTITASAVAKTFQQESGDNVLIICPPRLQKMWDDYLHKYLIAGKTLSHGKIDSLKEERRYKLVLVDESHNFRNRDSARHSRLRDYIRENDSRVILLTATPYNKAFTDIASQLRLFVAEDEDLKIRPDALIKELGGAAAFQAKHPNTPISSLSAFERGAHLDDWRELMRHYMVRRTRAYIKRNYAEFDEIKNRHYLKFADGKRVDFPERQARRLEFRAQPGDDYAKLYSEKVVNILGGLALPRYGLGRDEYLAGKNAAKEDEKIIANLTRAGARLRGFARSGLFKRLESGGETFLMSIRRHIVRNAVYLAALEDGGKLPVGQIAAAETDESLDEYEDEDAIFGDGAGEAAYKNLRDNPRLAQKFTWVRGDYFTPRLRADLQNDAARLKEILALAPKWNPQTDRKLAALHTLAAKEHGGEKILVFTQFKDTAEYLFRELKNMGVERIGVAHGGIDAPDIAARFSPKANGKKPGALDELRVLISTDVLSEGQNLQDAHIVVNYDLPWALVRLVQRAGRVDRIGQESPDILCYSAFPADGIENIIALRERLRERMRENEELVGTDEFFDDDKRERTLHDLYVGAARLDGEADDTDLLSRAYDIWRRAEKENPALAQTIRNLPDVVYSAKAAKSGGVVAYVKSGGNDVLAHLDESGEIVSRSQAHILDILECEKNAPAAKLSPRHHQNVAKVMQYAEQEETHLGGQLGGNLSVRKKLYERLHNIVENTKPEPLLSAGELRAAAQQVYNHPLTGAARDRMRRLFQNGADDNALQYVVLEMYDARSLCVLPDAQQGDGAHIICSMGLIK